MWRQAEPSQAQPGWVPWQRSPTGRAGEPPSKDAVSGKASPGWIRGRTALEHAPHRSYPSLDKAFYRPLCQALAAGLWGGSWSFQARARLSSEGGSGEGCRGE